MYMCNTHIYVLMLSCLFPLDKIVYIDYYPSTPASLYALIYLNTVIYLYFYIFINIFIYFLSISVLLDVWLARKRDENGNE